MHGMCTRHVQISIVSTGMAVLLITCMVTATAWLLPTGALARIDTPSFSARDRVHASSATSTPFPAPWLAHQNVAQDMDAMRHTLRQKKLFYLHIPKAGSMFQVVLRVLFALHMFDNISADYLAK